jgi:hypothetical protein
MMTKHTTACSITECNEACLGIKKKNREEMEHYTLSPNFNKDNTRKMIVLR